MGIFKAYDIRGVVPSELNESVARKVGYAFAELLDAKTLVVGRDARTHSPAIAAGLIEGIRDAGADVIDIGLASTPMAYFAIATQPCDGGINVTASHNGPMWNGFKLSRAGARPMSYDTGIAAIESRVRAEEPMAAVAKRGGVRSVELQSAYLDHLMRFFRPGRPVKLLCDAANGMGGYILPGLAERLARSGIELAPMFWELDGTFPNHEANPLKPAIIEIAAREVRNARPRFDGAASFDGDADRCAFVDESGAAIPNDLMTALLARELLVKHPGAAFVYDLRSSWVVPEVIGAAGGKPIRVRVGHSYIKETMRREGAVFGGELSGHYYWKDHFYCDSAMVTLVQVLTLLASATTPLSDRVRDLRRYFATGEINFEVENKSEVLTRLRERYGRAATRSDELDGLTMEFGSLGKKPWWWFNVRASNTEPLLRLNLEASEAGLRDEKKAEIVSLVGAPVH